MAPEVTLLEREVYSEAEAARLLGVAQGTLHYWLEGGTRGRRTYLPVIRPEATGSRVVTWGEFVEAALLHSYRARSIPMLQLRLFIQTLREQLGVPYPLAHRQPWTSGTQLLFSAQSQAQLEDDFWLVANAQGVITTPGREYLEQITWDGPIAGAYRPSSNPESSVVVNPLVRFGRPSVAGVSTSAIASEVTGGASPEEVAADFGIDVADVRWALEFESVPAA
jgi:uncharacterized protein (DUF433 family)